jgi:hypothetical protein
VGQAFQPVEPPSPPPKDRLETRSHSLVCSFNGRPAKRLPNRIARAIRRKSVARPSSPGFWQPRSRSPRHPATSSTDGQNPRPRAPSSAGPLRATPSSTAPSAVPSQASDPVRPGENRTPAVIDPAQPQAVWQSFWTTAYLHPTPEKYTAALNRVPSFTASGPHPMRTPSKTRRSPAQPRNGQKPVGCIEHMGFEGRHRHPAAFLAESRYCPLNTRRPRQRGANRRAVER